MSKVVESILAADDLPSPPAIALKLLELFSDPDVEVDEMAKIIGADPVLASKLLAYCNSPMFARSRETSSIRQAVMVIGLRAVKILALSFSLVDTVSRQNSGFDLDRFWSRSLATAVSARMIAESTNGAGEKEFLLGLLLDIGQIGLAHCFPKRYTEILEQSAETGCSIHELESAEWGVNHMQVGTALLKEWNFPDQIVAAFEAFETSDCDEVHCSAEVLRTFRILQLAQKMSATLFVNNIQEETLIECKSFAQQFLGIEEVAFAELFDISNLAWIEIAKILQFKSNEPLTLKTLESRARKGIVELSMGLHAENTVVGEQNAQLKINATIDSLTGLKNRRSYDEEAPLEWERANRLQKPFVLVMVDIDYFKRVNDTYGHAAGDTVLSLVAQQLRTSIRQYDSVYRFGGEEFVVIIKECTLTEIVAITERIRATIEGLNINLSDGSALKITASFGVAIHNHQEPGSLDELLQVADKLLYQAKNEGRNRVCANFEMPPIPDPCTLQVTGQHRIRKAVDLV